jgi:PKD repeat protein
MKYTLSTLFIAVFYIGIGYGQCDFDFTPKNPCPGETVTFTVNNPMVNATYTWDLDGDGAFDDGTGVMVTFVYPFNTSAANFVVRLKKDMTVCSPAKTVSVKAAPDASIDVYTGQGEDNNVIKKCSGNQIDTLGIYNTSSTYMSNSSYKITWGDGSPVVNLTNSTFTYNGTVISHIYAGLGYKTLQIMATHINGCTTTTDYQYFLGSNPSVGLSNPGNTDGLCTPASIIFPLSNYLNNPPGTTYTFFLNTTQVAQYNQSNVPSTFQFTFDSTSCGKITPLGAKNAFAITVEAKNPCGSSKASVEPITLSSKPIPNFTISGPSEYCPNKEFMFTNTSSNIGEYNTQTKICKDTLGAKWEISPGLANVDYVVTSGALVNAKSIKVKFLKPGVYFIKMTLFPTPACGPAIITKTITILEPPTAKLTTTQSNANGCAPLTVNFDNLSTGYQVSYYWTVSPSTGWQFIGGTNASSIKPEIIFNAPGTYKVTLTASNVCSTSTATTTIVVKTKPTALLPMLGPFCQNAALCFNTGNTTFDAGNGTISSYAWNFSGGTPNSSTAQFPCNINYSVSTATTFTVSVTATNECGISTATANFEVQVPPVLTMPPSKSFCENDAPFQLVAAPIGGTWSGQGVNATGLFTPSVAGSGTKTLSYKYGVGVCESTGTVQVTVWSKPTVDAGNDLKDCLNNTVLNLTGNTPIGGTWSVAPTGVVVGNVFNPMASGAGVFTLTYNYTDNNGCKNSDTRKVTVAQLPTVTTSDLACCYAVGSVSLPPANPTGGIWSGPGVTNGQFDPIAAGLGTHVVTYTYTDPSTNCTNTATSNITVSNPGAINAGMDNMVCADAGVINLNTGISPVGGTWSTTSMGLTGNTFNPTQAGAGIHTLVYSVGSGNCKVTDSRIITVLALPIVDAGPALMTCINETVLNLTGSTPAGGVWTSSGSGVVNGSVFNPKASGVGDFTLTYSFLDANSCSASDQRTITVHALPIITLSEATYCYTAGLVNLPSPNPPNGTWTGTGVLGMQFDPIQAGVGTHVLTYTYKDQITGCTNSANTNIFVINPAQVDAGTDITVCRSADPFNLNTGATPGGGTWSSTGNGLSGNTFDPKVAGPGIYTLTYSVGSNNCLVQDTRKINVLDLPNVVVGPNLSACIDVPALTLIATPTGGSWTGSSAVSGTNFNPMQAGPGNFPLTYTYTDQAGCTQTAQMLVSIFALPVVQSNDTTYCNTQGKVMLPVASPAGGTWMGTGIFNNMFDPIAAGGPNTYPAIYTYKNGNNCVNRDTIKIAVINPQIVQAGSDTAFCQSVTSFDLSMGISPAGGSWTSTGTGLTGNIFNPALAGAGIHTLTYAVGTGNCEVKDTRTIQVYALPMVDAGKDLEACASETQVQLNGTPLLGFWTANPAASITGTTWNPKASGVGTYTFTYTFTDPRGCVNTDQLIATVHPLPVPLANDTTYCNTPGKVLLPVSTPTGGSWHGQGISGLQFDPQGAGGVGTYPVVYTFTDLNSCTDSITVDIAVIDPPSIYAGVNDTICINTGTLQLKGFVPGTGGIWIGNGIVNNQTGLFDPLIAGGGQHPLVYTFGVGNCQVKDTTQINVIAIAIEAGANRVACLDDVPLQLTGFAPVGGVWTGAGITDPSGIFNTQVTTVGTHLLYYQYNDPILDCVFIDSISITVHPMPESDFAKPNNSCIDVLIPFLNLSQNTFMPSWTFGDGANSTLANPSHTYTDTGTYKVTLITKNEFGCIDSLSRIIFVTRPPIAMFSTEPDSGCAVLKVKFLNTSSGFETMYNWSFGDGQSSTLYDPGEISFQQGQGDTIYHIQLTAQNLCAVRTWTDSVKVFPWPLANFGTNLDTICTGETISFSNLTLGNPDSFEWDFGNGLTSVDTLPHPVQFFTDSTYKTYTIRLVATNFCGTDTASYPVIVKPVDVRAFFNIPNTTGCEPYTLDFTNFSTLGAAVSWEFGDGNTSAAPNPTHTYTKDGLYKVVQRASSGCGYDSTIVWITVLPAPDVSFNHAPQVCRNDTLPFNNTSPTPLSGTIWDFGDGDSSLLYDPVHAWAHSGVFPVTLTGISAANGCPASTLGSVNVLALPVIRFTPSQPDGCIPLSINFTNNSLNANYYNWNFGDGNIQIGNTVSHIYTVAGQYPVWLQGVDLNGCKNDTTLYYITAHPIPSPKFSIERDRLCGLPVTAQMVNQTPDATSYAWKLGNNTTSVQNNPSVAYLQAGDYTIQLIATNTFACKDTLEQVLSAYAIPEAKFEWDPAEGCAPLKVQFNNQSLYSTQAYWHFSDQQSSTDFSPAHTFQTAGFYGAQLIASHRNVCFDTLDLKDIIWVKPSPYANFSFVENLTMPPSGEFKFTDLSVDAVQWDWDFGDMGTSDAQNPEHRYYYNGPKIVRLLVTSENECTDDTLQVVNPTFMKGLFIPNAFTPGLNVGDAALFKPKGVGLVSYEIEVYSPFGQLLWRSDKLDEGRPAEAWDGTYDGKLMPQDVYTWKVNKVVFDNGTLWPGNFDAGTGAGKKVGSVTLIR